MADQEEPFGLKRQQIIDGAGVVFTECGYEGASMSRIALRASVSKGTLYNYFTGKSELFAAFVEQKATAALTQLFEPLDSQDDLATTLHKIGLRMMEVVMSPGSLVLYRIVVSEAGKFPQLAKIYWATGPERAITQMSAWLASQMEAGRLREADPGFAAEQFFALCQTRYCMKRRLQLILDTSPQEVEMVIAGAVGLFLDSYSPRPAAKPLATLNTRS